MSLFATNLRRLMARDGLTTEELARRAVLNERTIKNLLSGEHSPQPKTIHRLALGLEVSSDELFRDPALLAHQLLDRQTNPCVDEVAAERPDLFHGWREADFHELYSRFGAGGALTHDGVVEAASAMNIQREVQQKVGVILQSTYRDLLSEFVELLYRRAVVTEL